MVFFFPTDGPGAERTLNTVDYPTPGIEGYLRTLQTCTVHQSFLGKGCPTSRSLSVRFGFQLRLQALL